MLDTLRVLLLGVFGAAMVHISILFLLPVYSERDVWAALAARADLYTAVPLRHSAGGTDAERPFIDNPLFEASVCRFDLSTGMTRIVASGRVPFWSISVYDRDGLNVFSLNDRSAQQRVLDVLVADPPQMLELRNGLPETLAQSVLVQADVTEGMALVRVFVPDESWRGAVSAFLDSMSCTPV
ncbi:DUF1254 domain-containing protein [Nitratireductor pacificus]|uniref:DUF1254 domain-containing protein n=1 Tax=Nitratireductor pacificus pht-3B TaxID=391937 RepID=K2LPZ4_9HYPH|nr:DUF1254 domain-containing protein [Nitratireductor pacificus]EKF19789.1 hypothetical protein NA2_05593 [Nitratireductor pacificus pht-3B]